MLYSLGPHKAHGGIRVEHSMDGRVPEVPLIAYCGYGLSGITIPGQEIGHLNLRMNALPVANIQTLSRGCGSQGIVIVGVTER